MADEQSIGIFILYSPFLLFIWLIMYSITLRIVRTLYISVVKECLYLKAAINKKLQLLIFLLLCIIVKWADTKLLLSRKNDLSTDIINSPDSKRWTKLLIFSISICELNYSSKLISLIWEDSIEWLLFEILR